MVGLAGWTDLQAAKFLCRSTCISHQRPMENQTTEGVFCTQAFGARNWEVQTAKIFSSFVPLSRTAELELQCCSSARGNTCDSTNAKHVSRLRTLAPIKANDVLGSLPPPLSAFSLYSILLLVRTRLRVLKFFFSFTRWIIKVGYIRLHLATVKHLRAEQEGDHVNQRARFIIWSFTKDLRPGKAG